MSSTNTAEDVLFCPEFEFNLPPSLAQYILDENELVQIDRQLQLANQQLLKIDRSHSILNEFGWTNFTEEQLGQRCNELFTSINEVINSVEIVQIDVYNRLSAWQRNQRMARSGDKNNVAKKLIDKKSDLIGIQTYFGELYAIITNLRTLNNSLKNTLFSLYQTEWNNAFESLYTKVTDMLKNLISMSFVVEEQPPQIIKTTTK